MHACDRYVVDVPCREMVKATLTQLGSHTFMLHCCRGSPCMPDAGTDEVLIRCPACRKEITDQLGRDTSMLPPLLAELYMPAAMLKMSLQADRETLAVERLLGTAKVVAVPSPPCRPQQHDMLGTVARP